MKDKYANIFAGILLLLIPIYVFLWLIIPPSIVVLIVLAFANLTN